MTTMNDEYTPENGYYEFEHYLDKTDAPSGSVPTYHDGKLYWKAPHPQEGFHPYESTPPDGSVQVFEDGKKQWYRHPHKYYGFPGEML